MANPDRNGASGSRNRRQRPSRARIFWAFGAIGVLFLAWQAWDIWLSPIPGSGDEAEGGRNELRDGWYRQAKLQRKLLVITPEPFAQDVRSRLLGLYGSLGDYASARAINVAMIEHASANDHRLPGLRYNLAWLDVELMPPGDRTQAEASCHAALGALRPSPHWLHRSHLNTLLILMAEHLVPETDYPVATALLEEAYVNAERMRGDPAASSLSQSPATCDPIYVAWRATQRLAKAPDAMWMPFAERYRAGRDTRFGGYASALLFRHRALETLRTDKFQDEAERCLNEAVEDTWDLRLVLIDECYRPRKDWAAAARHLRILVQQAAADGKTRGDELPRAYSKLARALEHLGEKQQAHEWRERLLTESPDHPLAGHSRWIVDP